jgi:xanthine dehydrogenase molybdopterin binding subunit
MNYKIPHESAVKHVTGEALYVDDIETSEQLLHGLVVYSPHAHAKIKSFDLSRARSYSGVHAVLCHKDIAGENQMGPVIKDEICLAKDKVNFTGQALFLIAAESEEICRAAAKEISVKFEILEPVLDIITAIQKGVLLGPERKINCGDITQALQDAAHVIDGTLITGAQEHWYLETQACLCLPGEGSEINVLSSTQHPSETQALVAEVLGISRNEVNVEVRRLGGAFGGKETQANHTACWAALLCRATGRPVKIRLSRDDDQKMTGKRHRFLIEYQAAFDSEGIICGVKYILNSDGGAAADLSFAIMQRAMLHVDNAYYIPNLSVTGRVWKTNLPPNTAMRGFGAPQAMAAIETIIDRIARYLKKDPAEIRTKNLYGMETNNTTHYAQKIEHNHLQIINEQLMTSAQYEQRRLEVNQFNAQNEFYKKGLAITPVKFGISFTTSFLNQAGALVNVYQDGTILVNTGGVEMGQGLHTKIVQIAAAEFGVDIGRVKVNATDTSKVPNTSATAASSGTDLNGMAAKKAIEKLKSRITEVMADHFRKKYPDTEIDVKNIVFANDRISDRTNPEIDISFQEAIPIVYLNQVSLSAQGFYRTPEIGWDRDKGRGKPFHYFAYGMAVSEVILDTLTGHFDIICTDILHDVADSLNKGVDLGQVEGGFVQGVGWCTTEECKWDEAGNLLNHSPDTYKIPTIKDIPRVFRVKFLEGYPNPNAIRKSKAVGEPPFMLALSVWLAIKDAISAVAEHEIEPDFSLPATNEMTLLSVEKLKQRIALKKEPVVGMK